MATASCSERSRTGNVDNRWFGATPRFEDDKVFLPLQAADFLAGAVRQHLSNVDGRARELMDKVAAGSDVDLKELFPYGHLSRNISYMITYPREDTIFDMIAGMFRPKPGLSVFDKNTLINTKVTG
jgi:hypothetical protein